MLVISIILLVAGSVMIIVAAAGGSSISDAGGIIRGNGVFWDWDWTNSADDIDYSFDASQLRGIEIEIDAGEFKIVPGDELRVTGKTVWSDGLVCEMNEGILVIREDWKSNRFISWFGINEGTSITVTVPEDAFLEFADIELAAGKCDIKGINTGELEVSVAAGELVITGASAQECNFKASAGRVYYSGAITREGSFNCSAGQIELVLDGAQDDYDIDVEVAIGEITIDGRSGGGIGGSITTGDGDIPISLSCAAGMIRVDFAQ